MGKWVVALTTFGLAGIAACRLLLPEGMVVKGPILNSMLGRGVDPPSTSAIGRRFALPEGYSVELFADAVPNARFLRFSPGGSLVVSQPRRGQLLHLLRDADGDGRSDGQQVLLAELDRPHGIDFHDGHLYVGEASAITRVPIRETGPDTLEVSAAPTRIAEGIPEGGNHWSRSLRFGPDDKLYLSVGSSCNVCEEEDPRRAALLRFEADGSGEEIFASGLRNSVGFDWRPGTQELYATDNGRDLLGDDFPPCELNLIERDRFYGWPYANGDNRPDPDFGAGHAAEIARSTAPVHHFRAHNAPLGITFLRHPGVPESMRGAALVALHGSWNRSTLDGYKVVSLHWREASTASRSSSADPSEPPDRRGAIEERDFLTGFERDEDVIGRPVDVAEGPDGAIYVSDDYAGVIYRIRHIDQHTRETEDGAPADGPRRSASRAATHRATPNPLAELPAEERDRLTAAGRSVYRREVCGSCHDPGAAAPGVVVKPLERLAARYDIASLADFFLAPTPPMPVFALGEAERRALAVYLLAEHD